MTRVTIGIPAYNRASFLDETLESLLAQDWPDLELIVIDDGSTDDTPRVLERWTRRAANIQVHRQANAGEAAACNEAWRRATGSLFAIVGSDDPQPLGLVKSTVAFLEKRPDVIVSYPDWWLIDEQGRRIHECQLTEYSHVRLLTMTDNFVGPGAFIRRDRVVAKFPQLRDTRFRFVSDYYAWLLLAELGPFAHLPESVAAWRTHAGGATAANRRTIAEEIVLLAQRYFARPNLPVGIGALRSASLAGARLAACRTIHEENRWRWAEHLLAAACHIPASGVLAAISVEAGRGLLHPLRVALPLVRARLSRATP